MPDPVQPERRRKRRPANAREVAALDKKFFIVRTLLVVVGIALIVGIGIMTHLVMSSRDNSGALPRLVLTKQPEFVDSPVCDVKTGFRASDVRTFIKNIGDAPANNVIETFSLRLVPEKKVGLPEFDEIPQGNCKTRPVVKPVANIMAGEEEGIPVLPAPVLTMPPLLKGEAAQLYGTTCFYYSDIAGAAHASCETHHFTLANDPVFICDATPKIGDFDSAPVTTCGY